jgi:hypothetical protein
MSYLTASETSKNWLSKSKSSAAGFGAIMQVQVTVQMEPGGLQELLRLLDSSNASTPGLFRAPVSDPQVKGSK